MHYSVWHILVGSNVVNGSPTILMHKSLNSFHIFRGWACRRLPRPLVIIQWCSAALEAPWNTLHDSLLHCHTHDKSCQKSQLQIYWVWLRIWCSLSALVCSPWWNHKCAHACGHNNCRSTAQYSQNTIRYPSWWRLLLSPTPRACPYCHLLACYWSSLRTFWYHLVLAMRTEPTVTASGATTPNHIIARSDRVRGEPSNL